MTVLFPNVALDGIAAGTVDRAYRRWRAPRVKPGTRLRTRVGVVEVTGLAVVALDDLTEDDARRSGLPSLAKLRGFLEARDGDVYRIELRFGGDDVRVALREQVPAGVELQAALDAVAAIDRASHRGPWTVGVLRLIAEQPGVRAADLAPLLGRERLPFKADVRRLKELGLTESLPVGYRLSPRGEAVIAALDPS